MRDSIDQFMWGYQPHFRSGVESHLETALESVDVSLDPVVFLVGLADGSREVRHAICIEPETGPLQPRHFEGLGEAAERDFAADPETRIVNTHPRVHEARQEWLHRRARARAIEQLAGASNLFPGRRIFASSGGAVSGYEVHACISVDAKALDALPELAGDEVNRFPAPPSFVRHLIQCVLIEADIGLHQSDPGWDAIRRRPPDLAQQAAEDFCAGCSYRARNFRDPHFYGEMTKIANRSYEGAGASGRLLFTADIDAVEVDTRLSRPVSL